MMGSNYLIESVQLSKTSFGVKSGCQDPNEIVVDCPDPCPLSCDNLYTHEKFPCMRACPVRGCACREGYVRDSNNKCIPRDQCRKFVCVAYNVCFLILYIIFGKKIGMVEAFEGYIFPV